MKQSAHVRFLYPGTQGFDDILVGMFVNIYASTTILPAEIGGVRFTLSLKSAWSNPTSIPWRPISYLQWS